MTMRNLITPLCLVALVSAALSGQSRQPDWTTVDGETMQHFQALVRIDTMDLCFAKTHRVINLLILPSDGRTVIATC